MGIFGWNGEQGYPAGAPQRSSRGSSKPPKKGGGKLCIQIAPFAAWPALAALAHAIGQSIV